MMFDEIEAADIRKGGSADNVTADIIHDAVYAARPDVGAIVHLHTEAAVVSSVNGLCQHY